MNENNDVETALEDAKALEATDIPEPGKVVEISKEKKPSKVDVKRMQQYVERRKRLLNKGIPEDKVDQVIAEEDYRALPTEKKLERFQITMSQAFRRMSQDLMAVEHNINILADVMESNSRAMAKCLEKAGLSKEVQSDIIKAVEEEIGQERLKRIEEAKKKAEDEKKQKQDAMESSVAAELLKAEGKPSLTETPPPESEVPVPEGATTFGG